MGYFDDDDDNRDNERSGYECQHCGYQPTWKETDRGTCPQCAPERLRSKQKGQEQKADDETKK